MMLNKTGHLDSSWLAVIGDELEKSYMHRLKAFLLQEKKAGKTIFPSGHEYFQAFNLTPFDTVKVVIIGQDPYHGGQAHGLSFSVKKDKPIPPSLRNIYKELYDDLGVVPKSHGCLEDWAQQGVLLLNAVLTVQLGHAASHRNQGWEEFTNAVIAKLNKNKKNVVYMLWGKDAQKKCDSIDRQNNLVLSSVHPSPLSSHRGFFGSKPFSKANNYLIQYGKDPINW